MWYLLWETTLALLSVAIYVEPDDGVIEVATLE
jgi:hypothetical protein